MSTALTDALLEYLLPLGIPTLLLNPTALMRLMSSERTQAQRRRTAGIEEGLPKTRAMVPLMTSGRPQASRC